MFVTVKSYEDFLQLKENEPALLVYFSSKTCSVCHVLKPKVEEMARTEFPKMKVAYVKSDELPEVAAQNRVFTAPTILMFFEGREYIRKSRTIGIAELQQEIQRIYLMVF